MISSTVDVTEENHVYNISKDSLPEGITISAGSWLLSGKHHEARIRTLSFIFDLIETKTPEFDIWFFLGDSAWQDDTRIIRHKRLWRRLEYRGFQILGSSDTYEEFVKNGNKVKFFGAKLLSVTSIQSVIKVMTTESCSYIVAISRDIDINVILQVGWSNGDSFDGELLKLIVKNKGILFKVVGKFDDRESGFVGLGAPSLIKLLTET